VLHENTAMRKLATDSGFKLDAGSNDGMLRYVLDLGRAAIPSG
jgi:hypothetical protein